MVMGGHRVMAARTQDCGSIHDHAGKHYLRPGCFAWAQVVLAKPQNLEPEPTHFGRIGLQEFT